MGNYYPATDVQTIVATVEAASQATDAKLIAETLRGKPAAFGDLVRRYQDRLAHTVTHLCGSAEDAQDVVQDTFVQAFVKLDSFRGTSAFYTWLYRIAFNLTMSRRRGRRPPVSIEARREAGIDPIDDGDGPSAHLEQQDRTAQVQAALQRLSDDHRQVLVLRELDGWSYEQMAELLALPVGTIRSRLHRARLELKQYLQTAVEDEQI